MNVLTFAELRHAGLTTRQAVALVDGAADLLSSLHHRGAPVELPADANIVLEPTGEVVFTSSAPATESSHDVRALAGLLRRLLDLDAGRRADRVPGSLMVLMARALGEIDLPAPTLDEFRSALARVLPDPHGVRVALTTPVLPDANDRAPVAVTPPFALPSAPVHALPPDAVRTLRGTSIVREMHARTGWRHPALAFAAGVIVALAFTTFEKPFDRAGMRTPPVVASQHLPAAPSAPASSRPRSEPANAALTHTVVRQVLADIGGRESFSPSFSADGRAMYFHTGRSDGHLMRADFTADGRIASVQPVLADSASNFHPVPSPDGARIAFDSDREGVRAVYVANTDGSGVHRVSGSGFAAVPTWSPDGSRLAFVKADNTGRVWNVWVLDLADDVLHQISHHRSGQAWGASWFPDGRRLAYSREDQLVIVDISTGRQQIVRSPRPGQLVRTPSVSPDGTRVVLQVFGDGVWIDDLRRGRLTRVLTDRSAEEFRWSPDGRRIAYHARHNGRWGVWTFGES